MDLGKKEAYAFFRTKRSIGEIPQNASRIYNELIKFGSQYSQWSDVRHFRRNGVDDGGNDRHRECKFNEVAESYQHESIDRPKYAKTLVS